MFECLFLNVEFYLISEKSEFVPYIFVVETKMFLVYSVTLCCRMDILVQQMTEMILTY